MQSLIAPFLFQHQQCPLPGIGTLRIEIDTAQNILGEQKITSPVYKTVLDEADNDISFFTNYLAEKKNITQSEASSLIQDFSENILTSPLDKPLVIDAVGSFTRNTEGELIFDGITSSKTFYQDVFAERVIHPDVSHNILVGDIETDSTTMTDYYADSIHTSKSKRWIFAVLLAVIAVAIIVVYMLDKNRKSNFGNANRYEVAPAPKTYKTIP